MENTMIPKAPPVPVQKRQIENQMDQLTEALNSLEDKITKLNLRLICVTTSEELTNNSEEVAPNFVPLADAIYSQRIRIDKTNTFLDSLLERIEL